MTARDIFPSMGPMGPQDSKWKNVYIKDKPLSDKISKIKNENLLKTKNKIDDYGASQFPMENLPTHIPENENTRNIQKQNEWLRQYNEKLVKMFKQSSQGRGMPLYNQDIFSDQSHSLLKQTISSSEYISPLVKALEDENQALKEELNILSTDLSSFIDVVELLIDENKEIREHINMKNKDFVKLLETIGLNEGEQVHDLKHKIHIITEENNILIKHLDEMKKYKDNFDTLVFNKEQEMVKAKDLYDQLEYDLLESKKREDNFSRQISSMQPRYQELTELNLEQEKDIESLKHDINKFKNENVLLKSQVEFLQKTNEDLDLQKHLENDQLVQENHLLSHNCKDLKSQIQEKDRTIENNHEEIRKYRKENEELKEENDEITQILADKDVQLGLQKTRADTSIQREREAIEKIDLQSRESQKFQLKYQQLERQYNSIVEAHRIESNEKHLRYEKLIDTLKNRHKEHLSQKDEEIDFVTRDLENLRRNLEKSIEENNFLKDQISDNKEKEPDREALKMIEQQKLEISHLNKQITSLKLTQEQKNKKVNEDLEDELNILNRKQKEFEIEREILKKKNDDLISEINRYKKENTELINDQKDLKVELNKYERLQPENFQPLINENRELKEKNRSLEKKINDLIYQYQITGRQESKDEKENSALKKKVKELEYKVNEITELKKQIIDLNEAARQSKINQAESKIKLINNEIYQKNEIKSDYISSKTTKNQVYNPYTRDVAEEKNDFSPEQQKLPKTLKMKPSPSPIKSYQVAGKGSNYLSNQAYLESPDYN